MNWLQQSAVAWMLWGCSSGPLPDANDAQALAAIRQCNVPAPWWFGPIFGFDQGQSVAIRLQGLQGPAFDEAKHCLEGAFHRQGVSALIENVDRPDPPELWIGLETGRPVERPSASRRVPPEPVWRDVNGRPLEPPS